MQTSFRFTVAPGPAQTIAIPEGAVPAFVLGGGFAGSAFVVFIGDSTAPLVPHTFRVLSLPATNPGTVDLDGLTCLGGYLLSGTPTGVFMG